MSKASLPSPKNPLHEPWQELLQAEAEDIANHSGATWQGTSWELPVIGQSIIIDRHNKTITSAVTGEQAPFLLQLVALNYLLKAQDLPLMGRLVNPQEFVGGEFFFRGPHAFKLGPLEERFSRDKEGFIKAGESLGGKPYNQADAAFTLPVLPRIPLTYVLWCADCEFPAKISVLFDASAERHLALDMLWALVNIASKQLLSQAL